MHYTQLLPKLKFTAFAHTQLHSACAGQKVDLWVRTAASCTTGARVHTHSSPLTSASTPQDSDTTAEQTAPVSALTLVSLSQDCHQSHHRGSE